MDEAGKAIPGFPDSSESVETTWQDQNWRYVIGAIANLQSALKDYMDEINQGNGAGLGLVQTEADWRFLPDPSGINPPPRLLQLCQHLQLSSLECHILLLCAGVELSGHFPLLCAALAGDGQRVYVTYNLVLTLFPASQWHVFHPQASLRFWHLIDLGPANTLVTSPMRIDERILHYLLGGQHLDQRLWGIVSQPIREPSMALLPPSHQQLVDRAVAAVFADRYIVQFCGFDSASKQAIATAVCQQAGWDQLVIAADALPSGLDEINRVQRLCEREAFLTHSALVLDCDRLTDRLPESGVGAIPLDGAIARWIDAIQCPLILLSQDRRQSIHRSFITLEVPPLTLDEQRSIWQQALEKAGNSGANPQSALITTLTTYFNLSGPAIRSAATAALSAIAEPNAAPVTAETLSDALWNACLVQSRPKMDDLAQFIEATATWDDLVLPEKEHNLVKTIAAHVRQRATVYEQWGFAAKSRRGLGISALFAGPSGTGKTMAAEVLARDLKLNLYRIDLSSVVSKYIGETEKNLRRIFDAAETGGAILLFDEADALFGKRSEVKDARDRYANMEVSYLLQRIESYRGLAILTTNLKSSLDQAFLRRLRFIIQFPFPDANQRAEIWRRIFPQQTPTHKLAYSKLAQLQVSGGNIRNIALNAAFLAADAGEAVHMKHILDAAQNEYIKLERPLTESEVKGWIRKETQPFV